MTDSIADALAAYPRVGLTVEPTPLTALPRLSALLERRIHVLREDLTGFGLGGNKVRKLDYLIADALARDADVLIARGACSFTRNAAIAGKAFGLEVHLVVPGEEREHNRHSRALLDEVGAALHHGVDYDDVLETLTREEREVYELVPGGSNEIGALGYVRAFGQIVAQSRASGTHFDRIVVSTGSTATQVGLVIGQLLTGYATTVIGMAISQPAGVQRGRVLALARSTAAMLGIPFDASLVHIEDGFLGDGYAIPSAEGREAARMFAELEGLLLDQVYTGKAAAGIVHHARNGLFDPSDDVLFVHTGGNAGLFY
jgi:1-aminocyclopropane-1-carboxylate deaminase/D-cysteine desulfhydrase-like pyridoxal-dependent ACC family enzyme